MLRDIYVFVFVKENMFLLVNLPAVVTGISKSNHHNSYHLTCFCLSQIPMPSKRSVAPTKVVSRSTTTLVYIQYIMVLCLLGVVGISQA